MAQLGLVSLLWENFLIDHQLPVWVFLRGIDICTIIHSWPSTVSLLSCLGSWGPSTNFIKICNRLLIMPSVSFKLHQMFFILVNTFSKKDNHHLDHHLCLTATISTIITSSKRGLKKVVKFGVRRPCLFLRQHRPWMKTFFFWATNLNGSIIQEHNLVLIYQERKKEIYLSIHIMFVKLVLALYIAQSGRLSEYKWLSVAEKSAPWSFLPRGGNNVTTVVGISFFVFQISVLGGDVEELTYFQSGRGKDRGKEVEKWNGQLWRSWGRSFWGQNLK